MLVLCLRAALCNTEELHVVGNFAYNGYWDLNEDENYSDKRKQFFIKTKTEELHGGENPCLRHIHLTRVSSILIILPSLINVPMYSTPNIVLAILRLHLLQMIYMSNVSSLQAFLSAMLMFRLSNLLYCPIWDPLEC